jgi:hypothetical protein
LRASGCRIDDGESEEIGSTSALSELRIGGYPWPGRRLAPTALRACLLVELPLAFRPETSDQSVTLADLDARSWTTYSSEQCFELADLIVSCIRGHVGSLVHSGPLAACRFPDVPRDLSLRDLDLSMRTYNALSRTPLGQRPERLALASVDVVLGIRGIGAKGLVEMLVALEEAAEGLAAGDLLTPDDISAPPCESDLAEAVTAAPQAFDGGLTESDVIQLGAWCRGEIDTLPQSVLRKRLPPLPDAIQIGELGLQVRTAGALTRAGHARLSAWLRQATIRDLLALQGFGRTCLRDLLDSIVRLMLQPPPSENVTALAAAIAESEVVDAFASDDARSGGAASTLCLPDESIRDAATRIAQRRNDPVGLPTFAGRLRTVLDILERAGSQSVEAELFEIVSAVSSERQAAMMVRYRGWDGRGKVVMHVVGDELGVSRERVRQVCYTIEERLQALRPAAPVLRRALAAAADLAPIWADDLAEALRSRKLTDRPIEPQVLIEAATMLGIDVPIRVDLVAGRARVCGADDDSAEALDQLMRLVRRVGRRAVEHWGVGRIQDIAATVSAEHGDGVDETFVMEVLVRESGFRWLDEGTGWYWLEDVSRNRLTNQIDKVLCVAGQLPVADLRVAVMRDYRMDGQAPPLDILTELCRQLPNRSVQDDVVRAEPSLNPANVLADTEMILYEVLWANGSVMGRPDLEDACVTRGMKRPTFYVFLGKSPILICPRRGVYALIGTSLTLAHIDDLALRRQRGRVLVSAGQLDKGRFWLVYRLSEGMLVSGAFGVPTRMRPLIEGDYTLRTQAGLVAGTLCSRDQGAWGLVGCLRRMQAQAGQHLALVFDVNAREALATLGDETLVDQFVAAGGHTAPDDDLDEDLPFQHSSSA